MDCGIAKALLVAVVDQDTVLWVRPSEKEESMSKSRKEVETKSKQASQQH